MCFLRTPQQSRHHEIPGGLERGWVGLEGEWVGMVVGWFGGGLLHKVDGCELKVTYSARSDALELSGELPKQREAYTLSAATISLGVQCAPLYTFILYIGSLLVPAHAA